MSCVSFVANGLRLACVALLVAAGGAHACLAPGTWYALGAPAPRAVSAHEILGDMSRLDVVLLGEQHDNADHHRWQLQTLAALHVLRPKLAIGFEAFPRRLQPALDEWVAGKLTAAQFLERVRWKKLWNIAPELYLPLFEFARVNRIPMIALNVERTLTAAVAQKGWSGVPESLKERVSRPAAAPAAYEAYLFEVFKRHRPKNAPPAARSEPRFRFFVEAQTTWDRAMAEAIAVRLSSDVPSRPLIAAVMGSDHVRHGHGVAHQLASLGITRVGALLPVYASEDCSAVEPTLADAVFALPAPPSVGQTPP